MIFTHCAALTRHAHEELTEAVVELFYVSEYPHPRMMRTADSCVHAVPAGVIEGTRETLVIGVRQGGHTGASCAGGGRFQSVEAGSSDFARNRESDFQALARDYFGGVADAAAAI